MINQRVRSPQSVRRFPFPLFLKDFMLCGEIFQTVAMLVNAGRWAVLALLTSCVDAGVIPL